MLDGNGEDPHIFRSYENNGRPGARTKPITHGEASTDEIWEIGRATAAAPTYFRPQKIGDDYFSDGGLGYNNPSEEAYFEVLHKEGHSPIPINLFLSIGTGGDDDNDQSREYAGSLIGHQTESPGMPSPEPLASGNKEKKRKKSFLMKHLSNLGERLQKEVAEAKKVDRHMRQNSHREQFCYFRWTGGRDLAKLKLDKWKPAKSGRSGTQCDIENWVKKYMESPARQEEVKQIAEILVRVRRERIKHDNGDKWQRFTYCTHFHCPICNQDINGCRAQLTEHIRGCDPGVTHDTSRYIPIPPKVDGGPW
jgi:patatin-like phospholipase/acyl hydrolase